MDSMNSTSGKTRKSGHSLTKAATTSAAAYSQMDEWYLPQVEGLHLEGSVPLVVGYAPLKSPNNGETGLVLLYRSCETT